MKHLIRVIAVLITFTFGSLSSFFYNIWMKDLPQVEVTEEKSEPSCCYCEPSFVSFQLLDDSPDEFDGKWITTEATVYAAGSGHIVLFPIDWYVDTHRNNSEIHFTYLDLKDFKEFQAVLKSNKPFHKEVDVRITGTVKKIYDKYVGKSYLIVPDNIEIISRYRKFTPKAAA